MMKMAGMGIKRNAKEEEQARAWAVIHGMTYSIVATLFFLAMVVNWFLVWHHSTWLFFFILVAFLILAAILVVYGGQNRKRRLILFLGILCFFMTALGLACGFFWYYRHLAYYWRYMEMRRYTNVAASQQSAQFADGSMFLFTQDTRLDVMRSVGYKSKWSGDEMCVAPLVDSTMTNINPISYWAVGENCCMARSNYMCDDAQDPQTMSALVMLEPHDVVRPFMKWAVQNSVYPRYENAIKLQESAFATQAAPITKLVYWVRDPVKKRDSFYSNARNRAIWTTVVVFAINLITCYLVAYHFRYLKLSKQQTVNREHQQQQLQQNKVQRAAKPAY
jgi:hypothetical protein